MGRTRYSKSNEANRDVVAFLTYCGENLTPLGVDESLMRDVDEYHAILREKQGPVRENRVAMLKTAYRMVRDRKKNIF